MPTDPDEIAEFYTVDAFVAAVAPHFDPLMHELGFRGPIATEDGLLLDVRYQGPETWLLLFWDTRERLYESQIARATAILDDLDWLSPNEILVVRGARDRWVTAYDTNDVSRATFAAAMAREVSNLRDFCLDVLDGDWSIQPDVLRWHKAVSE